MLNVVTQTHGSCSRCLFLSALLSLPLPATNLQTHQHTRDLLWLSGKAARHTVETCTRGWKVTPHADACNKGLCDGKAQTACWVEQEASTTPKPILDNVILVQVGPECELVRPLVHTDAAGAQDQGGLLDTCSSSHPDQGLAGTARQHDDACRQCSVQPGPIQGLIWSPTRFP